MRRRFYKTKVTADGSPDVNYVRGPEQAGTRQYLDAMRGSCAKSPSHSSTATTPQTTQPLKAPAVTPTMTLLGYFSFSVFDSFAIR